MADTLRPGPYGGHDSLPPAEQHCSCSGQLLVAVPRFIGTEPERGVEVDCWFVLPDEPSEADGG